MSEQSHKYFTTGEFAKLCHISKQTLFYYDEIGLLSPYIKENNGYRYYTYSQYEVYIVIELLKDLGMPLKEIRNFLNNKTPIEAIQLLTSQLDEIDNKISKLQHIRTIAETTIKIIKEALEVDWESITVEDLPERTLLISQHLRHATNRQYLNAVTDFIDLCNKHELYTGHPIGAILAEEEILAENFGNYSYLYTKMPSSIEKVSTIVRPAGQYIIAYHKGNDKEIAPSYHRIFEFVKEHQLVIKNFAYEEYILDEVAVNGAENYVTKIMIPIK